ncbi:hypothetical protein KEJ18_07100 [Candidatus Bathyarchaeota archaeon]|nr:hypothetical protein [Candidatus Bathyarchaeota archaeon]
MTNYEAIQSFRSALIDNFPRKSITLRLWGLKKFEEYLAANGKTNEEFSQETVADYIDYLNTNGLNIGAKMPIVGAVKQLSEFVLNGKIPEAKKSKPVVESPQEQKLDEEQEEKEEKVIPKVPTKKQLKAVMPSPTVIRIYKRSELGKTEQVGTDYTWKDILIDGDVNAFISKHIVPKYGAGKYEIITVDTATGKEVFTGSVDFAQPVSTPAVSELKQLAEIINKAKEDAEAAERRRLEEAKRLEDRLFELQSKAHGSGEDYARQIINLTLVQDMIERIKSLRGENADKVISKIEAILNNMSKPQPQQFQQQQSSIVNDIIQLRMVNDMINEMRKEQREREKEEEIELSKMPVNYNPMPIHVERKPEVNIAELISAISNLIPKKQESEFSIKDVLAMVQAQQNVMLEMFKSFHQETKELQQNFNEKVEKIISEPRHNELSNVISQISEKINELQNRPKTRIFELAEEINALRNIAGMFAGGGGENPSWFDKVLDRGPEVLSALGKFIELSNQQAKLKPTQVEQKQLESGKIKEQKQRKKNNAASIASEFNKRMVLAIQSKDEKQIFEAFKFFASAGKSVPDIRQVMEMLVTQDKANVREYIDEYLSAVFGKGNVPKDVIELVVKVIDTKRKELADAMK